MDVWRVSAGGSHSLLLTRDGKLYSFGRGDFGRLGVDLDELRLRTGGGLVDGSKLKIIKSPALVDHPIMRNHPVTNICCGGAHSLALVEMTKEEYKQLTSSSSSSSLHSSTSPSRNLSKEGEREDTVEDGDRIKEDPILPWSSSKSEN